MLSLALIATVFVSLYSDDSDAAGAEFTSGDFRYATTSSTTVELMKPLSESISEVRIPRIIEYLGSSYRVTSVAEKAFYQMPSIKSIVIPETVTSIGDRAFAYCSNVSNLYYDVPYSAEKDAKDIFTEIGVDSETVNVTFGPHVGNVPDNIFKFNHSSFSSKHSKITAVVFEGEITSIGNSAFYYCDALKYITLPNSLDSIGDAAFYHCDALQSLDIPDSVVFIGTSAFEYCSGMKTLTVPENVESIGSRAFSNMTNLSTVYLNSISLENYSESPSLFYTPKYSSSSPIDIIVGSKVRLIPSLFAAGSDRIKSLVVPESVETIGESAFAGVSQLRTLTFYGIPSLRPDCFNIGYESIGVKITVNSICESGFLDGFGGGRTAFVYRQLPHVSLDMSGHTPSPVPDGWFLRDGSILKYYPEGADVVVPDIVVPGYTFKGLNTAPATKMPSYTLIYRTEWEASKYTVYFDANGGTGFQDPIVVEGNGIAYLPSTTAIHRDGYTFGGWSLSKNGSTTETISHLDRDTTVYAVWYVTITFDPNGGSGSQQPVVTNPGKIYRLGNTTSFVAPSGKTFAGWSTSRSGPAISAITPSQNTTIYALWVDNGSAPPSYTKYYTITLKISNVLWDGKSTYLTGGSVSGGGTYAEGSKITLKAVPEIGWKFEGWSDGNDSSSRPYTVASDKTLTATFSMISPSETAEKAGNTIGTGIIVAGIAVVIFGALLLYVLSRKHRLWPAYVGF